MPIILDIEDAIIAAISAAMPYARKVETYAGQLDEQTILQFVMTTPAVLIYMETNPYSNRGWPKKWSHPRFTVLVCDKNLRGNKEARRGDGTNPGTYQMLDDLFAALYQQTLGLDIDPLDIEKEDALINNPRISVYAATYFTKAAKN